MIYQERFQMDQRVIFRVQGRPQWYEGRVTRVIGEGQSYRVQKHTMNCRTVGEMNEDFNMVGENYNVSCGEDNIRVFPKERTNQDRLFEAYVKPPVFEDPFAHLYMKKNNPKPTEEEIAAIVDQLGEGTIPQENILEMFFAVYNRRKPVDGRFLAASDIPEMLESILPEERDLVRLSEMAKTNPAAMLQLADVLRFGLLGVPKDLCLAHAFYICAAIGKGSKEEFEDNLYDWEFGYPMGTSEALCAAIREMWHGLYYEYDNDDDSDESIAKHLMQEFAAGTMETRRRRTLHVIMSMLKHAVRRDWLCPFCVRIAKHMREKRFLSNFSPDTVYLELILQCRNARERDEAMIPFGGRMDEGFSVPSEYQLQLFKHKATEIFLGLPTRSMNPGGGNTRADLHFEYREMAFPPYPIVVMAFNPQSNYNYGFVKLPKEFECTPFSEEAFEYIWGCLVFNSMHRGDFRGGKRFRPAVITFADKPGDRLLAAYVKRAIGGNRCGTEIRVVNTRSYQVKCSFNGSTTLNVLQERLESKLVGAMKGMMSGSIQEFRSPTEQAASTFNNRTEIPVTELLPRVKDLKEEGNGYFTLGRMQPAKSCYSEAIDLIQLNANNNDESYKLLATLLSNRAACFLTMAKGMSPDSAKTALKNSLADCENALNNRFCARFMTESIKAKLERRKKTASDDITRLMSQTSRCAAVDLVTPIGRSGIAEQPPPQQQEQQQDQAQGQQQRGKKKKRRGKKKKKLQRQRQQRQQQNQDQLQETKDLPGDEQKEEPEEDDHGLISVMLGGNLLECKITPFVNAQEDTCPCCFDRFRVELSDTFCAVNACGHAYCLPCLSVLRKKSKRGSNKLPFNCPVCRIPIDDDVLQAAVEPVIMSTPSLQERISSMPLGEDESRQVVHELLLRHDFKVPSVLSALDCMLTDGLQASLRSSKDLTPHQKQKIYEEARKAVDELRDEAHKLHWKMDAARDLESKEYKRMKKRLGHLQNKLIPFATKNAVEYIWEQMNSAGKMGVEDACGEIEIDFHALHVHEAIERFKEQVLPILPAVSSVLLVVGRGSHSDGGMAKLKPALKRHIDNGNSKMRYSNVEGNAGMMRVRWIH
mmetsp:Transcript_320/g.723  ORF Transcript_320/g.723 Transcript_320/m.723 type:complete len:1098 (-) Transcript_320:219-3512(-)